MPSIFTHQRHEWMSVIQVIQKWHPKGNVLGTIQFLRGFPPCLFTIHTLKHAWQHFYFYNSAMIKTIQYIRSSSDLACFLFFQISLNAFHIDILASKTGVYNWIVRGITKWPQSKKAIMRHTAAPFLLATFKKHPPPFQHMCMWVELLVESKGNILLAFLLPKAQLNFTIGNEAKTALCAAARRPL